MWRSLRRGCYFETWTTKASSNSSTTTISSTHQRDSDSFTRSLSSSTNGSGAESTNPGGPPGSDQPLWADAAPISRPPVTLGVTRCLLLHEVAAATSRDGLRQIDRHALHRRVEAHQRARRHQYQQHQRQVLDGRLAPLHATHGMDANATCA